MLYDGYRFIISHQECISKGAMLVYRTALPFTPRNSLLFKTYEKETNDAVRVLCGVSHQWSPCLSAMHSGGAMQCVAFTSEGSRIATGHGRHEKITIWDAVSSGQLMTLSHPGGVVASVTFLSNDTYLASGGSNSIMLWDTISGAAVRTYEGHTATVCCLAVSPKLSRIFISGSTDASIRVWATTSTECLLVIQCHSGPVHSVALLPDGSQILSGSEDGTITLFDRITGDKLEVFDFHKSPVLSLAVNDSDELRVASAAKEGEIKIYNLSRKIQIGVHQMPVRDWPPMQLLATVAFSPDGKVVSYAGPDVTHVSLWNYTTGQISMPFRHQGVNQVAFSPNGTRLASGKVTLSI
jgi:WD40 repeat protein